MRTDRYRICSSTKLVRAAARDDAALCPVFNLVEVEPVGHCASLGTDTSFALGVLAGFDLVPCQVAYVWKVGAQLTAVARAATCDAIRSGELRLTGCAFLPTDGQGTLHQLGRIRKYVERGFRLPAGPLAAAPEALRDGSPSTALRKLNYVLLELLGGRLHWEPVTPPRSATPACRPHLLMLRFAMMDRGNWHLAAPRSSAAACASSLTAMRFGEK